MSPTRIAHTLSVSVSVFALTKTTVLPLEELDVRKFVLDEHQDRRGLRKM
jgi:hypothetical protein